MHSLAVFGITGRMGQSLVQALRETQAVRLSGAIASSQSDRLGHDAAAQGAATGVTVTADVAQGLKGASVAADFSTGDCVAAHAGACAAAGIPLLIGATGFDLASREAVVRVARVIPVLIAANTSVGVSVVRQLVSMATTRLGPSFDVEIVEAHHRTKRDSPSGTALALGEAVAQARALSLSELATYDRAGRNEPRKSGSIGFSSVRGGDIVGEHTVIFAAAGERVEITHRATDRVTFARGALRAAEWLLGQPAGLYGMEHVLGV
jgi:4-hydroxy-tetrahydrodipicolinate reductase